MLLGIYEEVRLALILGHHSRLTAANGDSLAHGVLEYIAINLAHFGQKADCLASTYDFGRGLDISIDCV